MKHTFLIFLFFSFSTSYAQELTAVQNINWLQNFEKIKSKKEKLKAVKRKIVFDSDYKIRESYSGTFLPKNTDFYKKEKGKYCNYKILFILSVGKEQYTLDPLKNNKTKQTLQLLSKKYIAEFIILKGDTARALYGVAGNAGVIYIKTKRLMSLSNKLKRIKNLKTVIYN